MAVAYYATAFFTSTPSAIRIFLTIYNLILYRTFEKKSYFCCPAQIITNQYILYHIT